MLRLRYIIPMVLPVLAAGWLMLARPAGEPVDSTFEEHPAVTLGNDKLTITVLKQGTAIASVVLNDDPSKLSPLWNPMRMAREEGRRSEFNPGIGQFVCVDGFGSASKEETAAGIPFHGEAHLQNYDVHAAAGSLTLSAKLPLVQENFTRTFRMVEGENVVYVDSQLESLLAFDKPVNWAEHATIGSPWLESGVTVVDVSGTRSQTRPWPADEMERRRLAPGQDFIWPLAPALDGGTIDMRQTPANTHYYVDHAATLLDPWHAPQWVTAINPRRHQILGYIFHRADYPWLQTWGDYPVSGKFARGMEFCTQPYDVSHRDTVTMGSMFDTPAFRWLPAKSKIETHYLMFFATVPEGFTKTDYVRLENGRIVIEDHTSGKRVTLAASRPL